MRSPIPPIVLSLTLMICACGEQPSPARPKSVGAEAPPTSEPEPEAEYEYEEEPVPGKKFGYESPYSHPESLLKPLDGFPLPASARLESQGRDLAVYEVQGDLALVETFYRERGFRVTQPGRLPGIIVTRTDTGTRLQVQPGKHRGTLLRFYR